jgi:uncharacterized protein (DUF983 family)
VTIEYDPSTCTVQIKVTCPQCHQSYWWPSTLENKPPCPNCKKESK